MVNFCAIVGCATRADRDVSRSFFRIPALVTHQGEQTREVSQRRRDGWLKRISRDVQESSIKNMRVCDLHFVSGHPSDLFPPDTIDWLPSVNLGHSKFPAPPPGALAREERARRRNKRRKDLEGADSLVALQNDSSSDCATDVCEPMEDHTYIRQPEERETGQECQTDLTGTAITGMQDEINRLTAENLGLKKKLATAEFGEESLKDDEEKVRFYTGLPTYAVLMMVLGLVSDHISVTARSSLTKFQQVFMVLMKLRLHTSVQDLAYRFNTSTSTISRTFALCVDVLYKKTSFFVKWPSREEIQMTMPMVFRTNFGVRVAAVIDCFEVFTDRPTSLVAQAQTWSDYKPHNTVKFLMGITPQGFISFVSPAWDGRASDQEITEESGILDDLLPGDVVLAGRGFDVMDGAGLTCAEVEIQGRKQLSMAELMDTRKLSSVRAHVERLIGCVRQRYRILAGPLPTGYLLTKDADDKTLMDKIVHLCCALTNIADTVLPFD
ncbi:uncharacterized protein LOC115395600 [Salarias fasciatus]|uniref:Uncharacterized LOC115395600 n=1 Tax=Salarias fasciatus TaxID=181472 RepID=A0A672FSL9_SALFA|nr:uncharacterized protein LOC115395600 [Salarias fasciatus]